MKATVVAILAALGSLVAGVATSGCLMIFIDEPTMPQSMLER